MQVLGQGDIKLETILHCSICTYWKEDLLYNVNLGLMQLLLLESAFYRSQVVRNRIVLQGLLGKRKGWGDG